jgi:hypothetical protein
LRERNNTVTKGTGEKKRARKKNMMLHNAPEIVMYILGAVIMSYLGIVILIAFVMYVMVSILWFMRFVCTNCPHFDNLRCPSGYAAVVGKLFKKGDTRKFATAFKRNLGIVFPSWFIPVIASAYLLITDFSLIMIILFLVFSVDAFVILPVASRKYGCNECDIRDQCPWMGRFGK